ncbi:hypothetical protein CUMW_249400 [Citrus unshiu]|uniref:Glutamine amidotransferase type-2 domain-containing protein n=1 Tax=Citrus unshiu TaxID=55188 RepID=A0A2H5QQH2_CITUN|nr:hypothetical protein CUMW_249400 [Citrus unshiu]
MLLFYALTSKCCLTANCKLQNLKYRASKLQNTNCSANFVTSKCSLTTPDLKWTAPNFFRVDSLTVTLPAFLSCIVDPRNNRVDFRILHHLIYFLKKGGRPTSFNPSIGFGNDPPPTSSSSTTPSSSSSSSSYSSSSLIVAKVGTDEEDEDGPPPLLFSYGDASFSSSSSSLTVIKCISSSVSTVSFIVSIATSWPDLEYPDDGFGSFDDDDDDKPRKECSVVGIYGDPKASCLCYLALHAMQHRGQEGAGIVAVNNKVLQSITGVGLVSDVFNQSKLDQLPGDMAIGHVRYSTAGSSMLKNV